jgi:3',5'-cyclic AMP phosphodiesterase CpdA
MAKWSSLTAARACCALLALTVMVSGLTSRQAQAESGQVQVPSQSPTQTQSQSLSPSQPHSQSQSSSTSQSQAPSRAQIDEQNAQQAVPTQIQTAPGKNQVGPTPPPSHAAAQSAKASAQTEHFIVKPYLQLGEEAKSDAHTATIVWFTDNESHRWDATVNGGKGGNAVILERLVALPGFAKPIKKHSARFSRLTPGALFDYSIKKDGVEVFKATATAKKDSKQPYKVCIFGDCGALTDGQKAVASQCFKAKPDLVVIPGDIVYQHGLYSQYLTNYFPVYNRDNEDASGVPLLRSTFTAGVLGNHDIALDGKGTNLDKRPDALAYFLFWNQPLNGYATKSDVKNIPPIVGAENKKELFRKSVGDAYPKMANYSFDFGNSHWVVLDGNYYMDWTNEGIRKWLADDLKKARTATWKFVTFHQPAFSIDLPHGREQRMRLVSDILEKYNVDMVFAGHAHCYERSYPLTFRPKTGLKALTLNHDGTVDGALTIDRNYDGVKITKPQGIIHIVTGAGGARLYPPGLPADFIHKYDSSDHSLTTMEVTDKALTIQQIDAKGKIVDQYSVTK